MKRIAKYFFQGLLFLVPIGLTIYLFCVVFLKLDGLLGKYVGNIPGLGFLIVIAGTTLVGFLATNFLTRRLLKLFCLPCPGGQRDSQDRAKGRQQS